MNSVRDTVQSRPRPASFGWAVLVPALLGLVGCGGEGPKIYRVPKESPPPPRTTAQGSPHGSPHGSPLEAALPGLSWVTPDGWVEHGSSGMSLVDFTVGAEAGVSIIPLPARGVRDVDVMNIFRQRFKLPDLDAAGLAALGQEVPTAPPGTVVYDMSVEAKGDGPRLVIAVVPHEAARWYVRLSGAPATVEAQKPAFLGFVGSLTVQESAPVARAPAPTQPTATPSGAAGDRTEALPEWKVPAGWKEAPVTTMLLARFMADGEAEITVSAFPGEVGGLPANVNRWRRQIGLDPVPDAEAVALLSAVTTADGEGWVVELSGTIEGLPARMVGAILPRGNRTWFYKMSGDVDAVQAAREEFLDFMKSARHPRP
jgi:hypothetical protein